MRKGEKLDGDDYGICRSKLQYLLNVDDTLSVLLKRETSRLIALVMRIMSRQRFIAMLGM